MQYMCNIIKIYLKKHDINLLYSLYYVYNKIDNWGALMLSFF